MNINKVIKRKKVDGGEVVSERKYYPFFNGLKGYSVRG